jgi:hypothetical protein
MADDLTDAEDLIALLDSVENHPYGKLLLRLIRTCRLLVVRVKALDDRVKVLENPPPP